MAIWLGLFLGFGRIWSGFGGGCCVMIVAERSTTESEATPRASLKGTHDYSTLDVADDKIEEKNDKRNRQTIRTAFKIAIQKLRRCLAYQSITTLTPEHKKPSLKKKYLSSIILLHNEIFTAAGYVSWLERNKKSEEVPTFQTTTSRELSVVDKKLKDLVLREVIWQVAEHIRHCPQRLNQLFYEISTSPDNSDWYNMSNPLIRFFLYYDPDSDDIDVASAKLKSPKFKVHKVLEGIEQFKAGKVNFDDIDDCGKWNEYTPHKTFHEPEGPLLFFLLIKYNSGLIQFKIWSVCFVYFYYKFSTLFPLETDVMSLPIKKLSFPAMAGFILLDFGVYLVLLLNEWIIRMVMTRQKRVKSSLPWLLVNNLMKVLQPFLCVGLQVGYTFIMQKPTGFMSSLVRIAPFYIGGRLLLSVVPEFFPYLPFNQHEPVLQKNKKEVFRMWKGLRKRYAARIAFFILVNTLSVLYERWLIIPTIDLLLQTFYCGDPTASTTLGTVKVVTGGPNESFYSFFPFLDINTQALLCLVSNAALWFVTLLAIAIDTGLSFITSMAFVGWIRGHKTQGTNRAIIQIRYEELIEKLSTRFIVGIVSTETDMNIKLGKNPVGSSDFSGVDYSGDGVFSESEPDGNSSMFHKVDVIHAEDEGKKLWSWCVDYWRSLDMLSDKEADYLKSSKDIDCTLLSSPDTQKHISFFINTLTVTPAHNYSFHDIPPTSILIPCYGEKLQFEWNPGPNYSPMSEFSHLVSKYPEEWLNLCERLKRGKLDDTPERILINSSDIRQEDPKMVTAITDWLSTHDQYVLKTIQGATDYYYALVRLAMHEGRLPEDEAQSAAKKKLQVILCMQNYQKRYDEVAPILARWLREFPCFQVVIDYEKQESLPEEFSQVPPAYKYATCLLEWDHKEKKVKFKSILPRTYPLRICDISARYVQGKSMNQIYGMTFAFGRFIQVLDANQGSHATEYLKFPSLLKDFRHHPQTGHVRYRIIGSREYIFTKNLGTVARCHAYQEWSFGTLVLRTYSDLGIRLHYGHPDVFHGPWAQAIAGLSKVNPDINTSEDVFGGFKTMLSNENSKHVEHIQFQKGRETGLANMTSFDTKISQGNSGLLRSRDVYHLMERLDYVTNFLLFQGVSGHFTTISMMMWSMKAYIFSLFIVSLSGTSLKALGNTTFSTEWLFHAGLTTIIPLVVEFLVEYGAVIGLLQCLFFLPISTIIYLFQMQTKHEAFIKGIFTGRAAHINTGRGLAIYRATMIDIFKNFGHTHVYPIMNVIFLSLGYKFISTDLGGGTLPLIMIYLLCAAVLLTPQIFNPPTLLVTDVGYEMFNFMTWIGKTESRLFLSEYTSSIHNSNSLLWFWAKIDRDNLPTTKKGMILSLFYHLGRMVFWLLTFVLILYPQIQFWVLFFLAFWFISTIIYALIYYLLQQYEQPFRIILIYLGCSGGMLYFFIKLGLYGVINFPELYVSFLFAVKILESFRGFMLDCIVIKSNLKYGEDKNKENHELYELFMVHVINKFFLVNLGRISMAFIWCLLNTVVALLMRPYWAYFILFGKNAGSRAFAFLKPLRKRRKLQNRFGIKL